MTIRTAIALASLTTALVAPGVALAGSGPRASHAPARQRAANEPGLAEQLRAAQQQITQLQAQLNALAAKVDAQGTTGNPQIQTQLAAAQADTAAASAKADAALVQAKVATEKAAKPPLPDVLPAALRALANTGISGRMYFNASHVTHEVNGIKTGNTDNGGGFAIKRLYLGIDHKFDDVFSASVTMDADSPVATTSGGIAGPRLFHQEGLPPGENPARTGGQAGRGRFAVDTVRRKPVRLSPYRERAGRPHQVRHLNRLGRAHLG